MFLLLCKKKFKVTIRKSVVVVVVGDLFVDVVVVVVVVGDLLIVVVVVVVVVVGDLLIVTSSHPSHAAAFSLLRERVSARPSQCKLTNAFIRRIT